MLPRVAWYVRSLTPACHSCRARCQSGELNASRSGSAGDDKAAAAAAAAAQRAAQRIAHLEEELQAAKSSVRATCWRCRQCCVPARADCVRPPLLSWRCRPTLR